MGGTNSKVELEKQLKVLNERGIEFWGVNEVKQWLLCNNLSSSTISALLDNLMLDGDGIIHLEDAEFEFISKSTAQARSDSERLLNLLKERKRVELEKQHAMAGPQPDLDKLFPPRTVPEESFEIVQYYHEESKNTENGGARSVKRDWSTQPRVWRRYYGAPFVKFSIPKEIPSCSYNEMLYFSLPKARGVDLNSISELFFYSLAVSARKPAWQLMGSPRSSYSKRVNASSGGLHPVEAYAVLPSLGENCKLPGIYHYSPKEHGLENRCEIPTELWESILKEWNLPKGSFFIGLTTLDWREIWKYGERGFRYSQLDIGHAIAALRLAASTLGWSMRILPTMCSEDVDKLLGLSKATYSHPIEKESPALIAVIIPDKEPKFSDKYGDFTPILKKIESLTWKGNPNIISFAHTEWSMVTAIHKVTHKATDTEAIGNFSHVHANSLKSLFPLTETVSGREILRTRRSALDFKGKSISLLQFQQFIARIVPSLNATPWDCFPGIHINISLFVYRVEGLKSGLYMLVRDGISFDKLKETTKEKNFVWEKVSEIPTDIPLYFLQEKDSKISQEAASSSCEQNMVANASFCCCMFTDMYAQIKESKDFSLYRKLHWEAGIIGQVLYNEAYAMNLSATGLGCFIDDEAAAHFALGKDYQPLYHFTAGHGEDVYRYPAYAYEKDMYSLLDQED